MFDDGLEGRRGEQIIRSLIYIAEILAISFTGIDVSAILNVGVRRKLFVYTFVIYTHCLPLN
jgi:hypothetical protein